MSLPRETFFYSPQLAPRYLIVFAPAFYALLAWGISALGGQRLWPRRAARLLRVVLSLLVLGAAVYGLWSYYPERILIDDYKSLRGHAARLPTAGGRRGPLSRPRLAGLFLPLCRDLAQNTRTPCA